MNENAKRPSNENTKKVKFAETSWCVEDVTHEFDVTDEQAEDFLIENAKYIQEAMVRRGFEAIDDLVPRDWKRRED